MLDPADVLLDRKPLGDCRRIERPVARLAGEAQEIPRAVDEGVERVGIAHGRAAASGTGGGLPGGVAVQRIAGAREIDLVRQLHRQCAFRQRHHAAFGAVHDRNRTAPGTLARHQPVAQTEIHRAFADARLFQPRGDFLLGVVDRHAIEEARIRQLAGAGIGLGADGEAGGVGLFRQHHGRHGQIIFAGEI